MRLVTYLQPHGQAVDGCGLFEIGMRFVVKGTADEAIAAAEVARDGVRRAFANEYGADYLAGRAPLDSVPIERDPQKQSEILDSYLKDLFLGSSEGTSK